MVVALLAPLSLLPLLLLLLLLGTEDDITSFPALRNAAVAGVKRQLRA
jgi:hypothetical protein